MSRTSPVSNQQKIARTSLVPTFTKMGVGRVQSSYHLPADLVGRAQKHVRTRANYAVETAAHAFYIARGNYIARTPGAAIKVKRAQYQNETGTVDANAAHVLPGQVTINKLALGDLVLASARSDKSGDCLLGAVRLNFMSSATHILPLNFNKVDTRFERVGGIDAYEELVRTAWNAGFRQHNRPESPARMLAAAYDEFRRAATVAFQVAIRRLEEKVAASPNDTDLQAQLQIAQVEMAETAIYQPEALHSTLLGMLEGTYNPA